MNFCIKNEICKIQRYDKMFNKKLQIISDYKNSFDSASLGNESLGILAE